jgi:hypothetical protein
MTEDKKRESILKKAEERGYSVLMHSSDHSWYSFMTERHKINLQVHIDEESFILSFHKGIVKITTDKCGSFMNDKHFDRIEREIRRIAFDLL